MGWKLLRGESAAEELLWSEGPSVLRAEKTLDDDEVVVPVAGEFHSEAQGGAFVVGICGVAQRMMPSTVISVPLGVVSLITTCLPSFGSMGLRRKSPS